MDQLRNTLEKIRQGWDDLEFSNLQRKALLVLGIFLVAGSGLFILRGNSQEVVVAPPEIEITAVVAQVMVDVAGAVVTPGVYSLPINSRVIDAIVAAGNVTKGADLSDINLARILKDGEQVYVYPTSTSRGSTRTSTRVATPRKSGPIILNRATAKEFESLDGIGPVIAKRIVAYRNTNGPFLTLEGLLEVSGIGPAKFAQLKEKVRL
jgi:competence protein ComEA